DSCYSIRYCRIPPLKSFASMPVSGRARQLRGARRLTTRTDVPEFSLSGDRDPSAQHPPAEVARFRGVITVTSGLSDRCHRHRVSPPFLRPASSLTTVARTPRSPSKVSFRRIQQLLRQPVPGRGLVVPCWPD